MVQTAGHTQHFFKKFLKVLKLYLKGTVKSTVSYILLYTILFIFIYLINSHVLLSPLITTHNYSNVITVSGLKGVMSM